MKTIKKLSTLRLIAFLLTMVTIGPSCEEDLKNLPGYDIRLFKHTPVWKLAKAVQEEDTAWIRELIQKDKYNPNYEESKFGETLLFWAVYMDHYPSVKALLENGTDPNIVLKPDSATALMYAADKPNTSEYVRLLLRYGANPNAVAPTGSYGTPLITAAGARLESVKLLVAAGANINYACDSINPLEMSLTMNRIDITRYFIIEKGVNFITIDNEKGPIDSIRICRDLRYHAYPFDSKEYKIKMEIVRYIKEKAGLDYSKEPIPKEVSEGNTKEYLDKY